MRLRLSHCLLLALFALAACSDDNNDNKNNTKNPDMAKPDMKGSPDMKMLEDMPPTDMGKDMEELTACTVASECSAAQNCIAGFCRQAPSCTGSNQWGVCGGEFAKLDPALALRGICVNETCRVSCHLDSECGPDKACGDDGLCIDFGSELTGKHPGAGTRAPVKVGVGNRLYNFPIGLPAAGYGGGNSRGGRYTDSMSETWGEMHGLYARALVIDNGERQLALVRLPVVFPTAPMHEAVARKLQAATGADWRDSLVISGTHTHSGPGRLLHLPRKEDSLLPLGPLGTDLFHQQAFDWYVDSISDTVLDAINDLAPSKLSWHVMESFDTDDIIASDRWGSTPPFDDNRILLMRVDDMNDKPRAVMMSFGMHGTWNSDREFLSEDAAGSVERGLERKLGKEFGTYIPTMFVNANGGSMSPRGDRRGHDEGHKFEYMGNQFAERVWPALRDMQGKTDISLGGVTHRFPIIIEDLDYKEGEFVDLRRQNDTLRYGGLQCSISSAEDNDYATHADPDKVTCLALHSLLFNRPPTIFVRSQVSALEIDGLTMVTLPGESVMELGWQMARALRDVHQIDPSKSWVIGYAQDHKFYMTPSNLRGEKPPYAGISLPMAPDDYPDYAISYFQGGYEPGFMPWGHHFADFLMERIIESVAKLQGTPMQMKLPEVLPMTYSRRNDPEFGIDISSAMVGNIVEDVPAQVRRLDAINFAWVGGDPAAEMPQVPHVILEREQPNGSFAPVIHDNQRPYDNRDALMVTRTRQTDTDWEWAIYWEELKNFPVGKYRFAVSGHYQSADGLKPYTLNSGTFEVIPTDAISVSLTADLPNNTLSGTLAYPVANAFKVVGPLTDPAKAEGSYRLRHPEVPTGVADPVIAPEEITADQITIVASQNGAPVATYTGAPLTVTTTGEVVNGRNDVPVTRYSITLPQALAAGTYDLSVSVTDAHGNTGSTTTTITAP